jgi:predicted Fe-Mo cluster-binding NifX family protein
MKEEKMREKLRTTYILLVLILFFVAFQQNFALAENSKSSTIIAIAAVGDSANSEISKRAGRAPYYLIFNEDGIFIKSVKNKSQMQGRGTRFGVIDILLKESVKTIVAGNFGDKMRNLLETNKIIYYTRMGIAKEVVETITKNKKSKNAPK